MDHSDVTQNRKARRSNVLMAASVESDAGTASVKLRNLSREGALVEGADLPSAGAAVLFRKGDLVRRGSVAWLKGARAGVHFDEPLDPEMLLHHMASPRKRTAPECRRPPIRKSQISAGERRIAETYIFGKPTPTIGD